MIDLHLHSNLSDGSDTVEEILNKLKENNIKYFSITDHDNCQSTKVLREYKSLIDSMGLKYINGIELSIDFEGESMHILVYDYDIDCETINNLISKIFDLRIKRVQKRVDTLAQDFNIVLSKEEIDWLFSHTNPGKPHIAQILIKRGYASSIHEAIQKYLYHKFNGEKLDAKDVVKELADNGYFVGIAHPLGGADEKRISREKFMYNVETLKSCGIRFLECYYSLYDENERAIIKEVADKYGLLLSGGSDYHGKNKTVKIGDLGKNYVPNVKDLTVFTKLFG